MFDCVPLNTKKQFIRLVQLNYCSLGVFQTLGFFQKELDSIVFLGIQSLISLCETHPLTNAA
jgi:hypothetical protein